MWQEWNCRWWHVCSWFSDYHWSFKGRLYGHFSSTYITLGLLIFMEWLTSGKIHLKNSFVFTENFPSHPSPSVNTSLSLRGSSSYAWEIEGMICIRKLKLKALSWLFQDWNPSLLIPCPIPFLLYVCWGMFVFGTFLVKKKSPYLCELQM